MISTAWPDSFVNLEKSEKIINLIYEHAQKLVTKEKQIVWVRFNKLATYSSNKLRCTNK